MKKQNSINKNLLSAENIKNTFAYENFAMQLLNRKESGTNVFAITGDTKSSDIITIVSLNIGYNLKQHNNKVLVINLDINNLAINDLLLQQNNDENVISYGDIDVLLPTSIDLFYTMTDKDIKDKYSDYDYVIFIVPSPKYFSNYLAIPKNVEFYILVSKFLSSFYAVNKCVNLLESIESKVIGSVYIKLK